MKYIFYILFLLPFLTSCNQPISNPESLDPGYSDIKADLDEANGRVASIKASIKEFEGQLTAAGTQNNEKAQFIQKINEARGALNLAEQQVHYFQLALESRKKFATTEYLKSFKEGKKWPSEEMLEAYRFQRKLSKASKNWDDHVPKSNLSQKKGLEGKPEDKKEGGKSESGGH